ncbi:putative HTH-type transcriptional regulator YttP [Pseudodesulfovibrio hydrargyri]|uniref:Putative HTH-type transcriptional regulator YttP n=1 Tax=Pseudodesulfovibrio hydrargyri TaxID=2125990 RepID=A0A1J5N7N3_9BACT|nr:CerR family C-terminal domain-containing protein [Pseudodesulfovibrio hydrargyri]OIQ50816.1 putative HTH-type transcriptional regulator YttP [Pseudodesulfovibrio hydrargyri]
MSDGKRTSRRRAQGEETRATLLHTGAELFAKNGYNGVSMRTLASEAGVNLATVGYHFGGKAGLYEAIIREIANVRDQIFPPIEAVRARLAEAGDTPEEKARVVDWFMRSLIDGLLVRSDYLWGVVIVSRELVHPTELFPRLETSFFNPNLESLSILVKGTAAHCRGETDALMTGHLIISVIIKLLESHALICKRLGWDSYAGHHETIEAIIKTRIRGLLGLPMENAQ